MSKQNIVSVLCVVMMVMMSMCHVPAAASNEPEIPLTAQGEKLLATYTEMLDSLKAEIAASAPVIDEQRKAALLATHAAVANVPAPPNPNNLKNSPPRYADSNPPYKEAQADALIAARAILADVDSFLATNCMRNRSSARCSPLPRPADWQSLPSRGKNKKPSSARFSQMRHS